jgi:uncharacterized cupin superfamily protein
MSTTTTIQLESHPTPDRLAALDVYNWPIWTKHVSEFPWTYDEAETCYILEGEVTVTPDGGEPITIRKGDLVTFSAGLACTWNITQTIRKHYKFG